MFITSIFVVLDTGSVRNTIHGDARKLDLERLAIEKREIRVSIAGSAFAELLEQLIDKRIEFADWLARLGLFEAVLDDEWPLFPSGRQLTAFSEVEQIEADLDAERRISQAWWRLLRRAPSVEALKRGEESVGCTSGQIYRIALDESKLRATMAQERNGWIGYVKSFEQELVGGASRGAVLQAVKSRHGHTETDAPDHMERLAPVFEMIATLVQASLRRKGAYDPSSTERRGDTFDMNLLYVLAHPRTIVVTTDGAFVNRLHQTHLPEALRVQLVDEFNDRLRAKTLAPLVSLD